MTSGPHVNLPGAFRLGVLGAALLGALGLAGCANPAGPDEASTAPAVAAVQPATTENAADRRPSNGPARDAFVLLSGGGTPLSNNYSQYLQAKAIATFFERNYPAKSTWMFFGVGNREGEPAVLADARKQLKRDGLLVELWLPGPLRGNRPATRESFLKALREEILPTVHEGGTLFLFVGDHGELLRGDKPESAVTLWELKQRRSRGDNWFTDAKERLSVTDLRRALSEGLGRGRVVFCMTQCHSGGFHFLGVPREMTPPADWFTAVPKWVATGKPEPLLAAAGFTATDEESPAAGCEADPDPETWAGYERFVPENLLGLDLFTLAPATGAHRSFAEAHEAATLVDQTIDKPRSSSEQYLERWASLIETRLAAERRLTPAAAAAVKAFQRAVDTGRVQTADREVRAKEAQFNRFTRRLTEQNGAVKNLLLAGTRQQLEAAMAPGNQRIRVPSNRTPRASAAEVRQAWTDTLRPAWKAAVLAGKIPGLSGAALDFEKHLLQLEDQGRDFMLARGERNPMLNELYWRSGYAHPEKLDPAKAEAVTRWGAERRRRILEWAQASGREELRVAAQRLGPRRAPSAAEVNPLTPPGGVRNQGLRGASVAPDPLSRKTATERVLFYRRVLAAWEFLVAMDARPALAQLQMLMELERTPLPPSM